MGEGKRDHLINWKVIRNLTDSEANDMTSLLSILEQVAISKGEWDERCWSLEIGGVFKDTAREL